MNLILQSVITQTDDNSKQAVSKVVIIFTHYHAIFLYGVSRIELKHDEWLAASLLLFLRVSSILWSIAERMNGERLTKIIYKAARMSERERGRHRIEWMEGIENILIKGMRNRSCRRYCMRASIRVEKAKDVCMVRVKWRSIIPAYPARDIA
jgi:hypothetical protein